MNNRFNSTHLRVPAQLFLVWLSGLFLLLSSCSQLNPYRDSQQWEQTISRVSTGIVNIEMDVPVSFDGLYNQSAVGTGFVVDAERGIILTNRHIVTPGPVTARAIFLNHEEVELKPLYRDPVHDFGFYSYDPSKLLHIAPHEFVLAPEKAKVGLDIRVIGNDAGQKISILDGTLARLDSPAPNYGDWRYNDFNTFYFQAASNTSGGSSGSPVLNEAGEVVALNAGGGRNSASSFYLPLERVVRALKNLQSHQENPRGTLQTTFTRTPYPELRRLGLKESDENFIRSHHPSINGLLVVSQFLPGSDAARVFEVGDILLSINGREIINFLALAESLDNAVNQSISVELIRKGEKQLFTLTVSDLHALTPDRFIEYDSGIFHTLSYQQARHFNKPVSGVYVAQQAKSFDAVGVKRLSVITAIEGKETPTLEAFKNILEQQGDGKKIRLRYFTRSAPNAERYGLATVNWDWQISRYCQENSNVGYWECEPFASSAAREIDSTQSQAIKKKHYSQPAVNRASNALVKVSFNAHFNPNDLTNADKTRVGTGVIVDSDKGYVIVSRTTVPSSLGNVSLNFFNSMQVPAKIEYLHPQHNLALLSYDPEMVASLSVGSLRIRPEGVNKSESLIQLGFNKKGELNYRQVDVDRIDALNIRPSNSAKYRDFNMDVIYLEEPMEGVSGALIDESGNLTALWSRFEQRQKQKSRWLTFGIPAWHITDMVERYANNTPYRSLEIELSEIPVLAAVRLGLNDEWIRRLQKAADFDNSLLKIVRVSGASPAYTVLKHNDTLLAVNGVPMSSYRAFEHAVQQETTTLTFLREGQVMEYTLEPRIMPGQDFEQLIQWSGARLQDTPRMIQLMHGVESGGLWVNWFIYGSPAVRYGLPGFARIVEVDGEAIRSANDFIAAVKDKKHQQVVRIKTIDVRNKPKLITLRVDKHYWPGFHVYKKNGEWTFEYL